MENRCLYSALLASACESDVVGLVQNADATQSWFAPMLAQVFNRPVIGIISEADTVSHATQLDWAADCLAQAGAEHIFITSSQTGEGLADLMTYLNHSGE